MNFNVQDFLEAATSVANGELAGQQQAQQEQYQRQQQAFQQNMQLFSAGAGMERQSRQDESGYLDQLDRDAAYVNPEQQGGYRTEIERRRRALIDTPSNYGPEQLRQIATGPNLAPGRNALRPIPPTNYGAQPAAPQTAPQPAPFTSPFGPQIAQLMQQVAPLLPGGDTILQGLRQYSDSLPQPAQQPPSPGSMFAPPGFNPVQMNAVDRGTMQAAEKAVQTANEQFAKTGQTLPQLAQGQIAALQQSLPPAPYNTPEKIAAAHHFQSEVFRLIQGYSPAAENAATGARREEDTTGYHDKILALRGRIHDENLQKGYETALTKATSGAELLKIAQLSPEDRAFKIDQIGQMMAALGKDPSDLPADFTAILSPQEEAKIGLYHAESRQLDSLLPGKVAQQGATLDHTVAGTEHLRGQERRADEQEPYKLQSLRQRARGLMQNGRFDDRTKQQILQFQKADAQLGGAIASTEKASGLSPGAFNAEQPNPQDPMQVRLAQLYHARTENQQREQQYLQGLGIDRAILPGAPPYHPATPPPDPGNWFAHLGRFLTGQGSSAAEPGAAPAAPQGMPAVGPQGMMPAPVRIAPPQPQPQRQSAFAGAPAAAPAGAPVAPGSREWLIIGGKQYDPIAIRHSLMKPQRDPATGKTIPGQSEAEANQTVYEMMQRARRNSAGKKK